MTKTVDYDALGVPPELRPVPGRKYRPIIRPLPSNRSSTAAGTGTGISHIPHFRNPIFVSHQGQVAPFDGGRDDADMAPHGLRKKRKTPAFQLSSGRHEIFGVYEGDVVDGTNRHERLPPIMPSGAGHDPDHDGDCDIDGDQHYLHDHDHDPDHDHEHDIDQEHDHDHDYDHDRQRNFGPGDEDGNSEQDAADSYDNPRTHVIFAPPKPPATRSCDFRKLQFLRRKAALITLFLDATSAIKSYWKDEKSSSTASISKNMLSKLPEVDAFEKLLPALEDVGVGDWPADDPGWRTGLVNENTAKRLGVWKARFAKRRKLREGRKVVHRGGWAPEGSFELEIPSKAGVKAREGQKSRASLQRLAVELRQILLSIKPRQPTITADPPAKPNRASDGDQPTKAKRRMDTKDTKQTDGTASVPVNPTTTAGTNDAGAKGGDMERAGSGSKEGSEAGTGGKKKPKKKKRSVLANQSNPHHVDNYRPSRTISNTADPFEPYPSHASLLFPPSMNFLSARPDSSRTRPSEDEYICCFCEYDLFYGSEARRKAAIRKRKQELKRKEIIKNKAKNVAEGKGKNNEESEYEGGDGEEEGEGDGDDDIECQDGGYGKCSCGRALGPHGDKDHHLRPPDPDPDPHIPATSPAALPPVSEENVALADLLADIELPDHVLRTPSKITLPDRDTSRASTPSID